MLGSYGLRCPARRPAGFRRFLTGFSGARAALAALVAATVLCAASAVAATEGGVLFLSSFSPTVRWTEAMTAVINEELAGRNRPINLYVEFLDRSRLPGTPSAAEWAAFLAIKYRGVRPEVVIADGAPAIELMAEFGPRLFGSAPVVGVFPNFDDLGAAGRIAAVQITTGPHIDRTVDMAFDQWPDARKLVIVSDDSGPSHHLAKIIRAAVERRTDRRVAVEHLSGHRIEELESALAALPRDSIVLYTHLSVDGLGRHFRPEEAAARLARVSAAPFYVLFEPDIGSGAIGGHVNNPRVAGRVAIRAALNLLGGIWQPPAPGEARYSSGAVVDWRQLRRWGIGEGALPPDTDIRFRQRSVFEEHFAEALTGLAFIAALSAALATISILHLQRGRLANALRDANNRLEERVAARTRDIERALTGEQAARRRLRDFLDMATHEFKTPLAVIDSSVQMLELQLGTAQDGVARRLTLIRRSARRVIDLVETCLAEERIEDERPVKARPFAPAALIGTVAERQRGHGATIRLGDTSGLPSACVADPELLGIALDALLDNARRYGAAGGPIEVTAEVTAGALAVSVADRGPGIPGGEADRVFEKHYRGSRSRGTPGTGIGLSLVKTIAELHGGRAVHRARDGGGAVFTLTVPLVLPPERDDPPVGEPAGEDGAAVREGRPAASL